MRASTLWQPWASLVAIGAKPFETRSYPPPAKMIGQRIAIHAAARPIRVTWRGLDWDARGAIIDALNGDNQDAETMVTLDELPHGSVVCTAVLAGAALCGPSVAPIQDGRPFVRIDAVRGDFPAKFGDEIEVDCFGDYSPGRWAWRLTDVQALAVPEPAKGKQGWWEWSCPGIPLGDGNYSDCGADSGSAFGDCPTCGR